MQKITKIVLALLAVGATLLAIISQESTPPGPGMVVGYDSVMPDKVIEVVSSAMPNGQRFTGDGLNIGSTFGTGRFLGSAIEGAAPDGRDLPEWVEFEWQEWPYPYPEKPQDPHEAERWSQQVHELAGTLPHKKFRVLVRDRVPADVINEATLSAIEGIQRKKLPKKKIWLYFVWHPKGIWFRWRLTDEKGDGRSGGDEIEGHSNYR